MSTNLKKFLAGVGVVVAGGIVGWIINDIGDEVGGRVGFKPRHLVPEGFLRPRPSPAVVVKEAEKPSGPKPVETGSLPSTRPGDETARATAAKEKCQREKSRTIAEEESRIAGVEAGWQDCLKKARWWPLVLGDAKIYCRDWEATKMGLQAGLEVWRAWKC